MKSAQPFLFLAGIIFLIGATANYSGDKEIIARLTGEVLTLQKQVRDLQESFDKNSGQTSLLLQKMSENSEISVRSLGQIEESLKTTQTIQNNSFTGANTRISRLADQQVATDQKLTQIISQVNSLKNLLEQQQKQRQEEEKRAAATPPRFDNPEQLYAYAYSQFTQGKYDEAITNFRRYVEAYGTTEAADNAQYWIGEGLFLQMRYADALVEFEKLLTIYPNGDKVVSAQLKKGLSLLYLERREEGVNSLRQVIASSPNSNEAALAKQELERLGENPSPSNPKQTPNRIRPKTGKP